MNIKNIFKISFLVFVIGITSYILYYVYQYLLIDGQEILLGFSPHWHNHGRYLTAFLNYFSCSLLPELINIHPFDVRCSFVLGFQICIIVGIVFSISNGLFLFTKKKSHYLNPIFSLLYLVVFFELINGVTDFFHFKDLSEFYEYMTTLLFDVLFLSFLFYFFTEDKIPYKKYYPIIFLLTFIVANSVECFNFPLLIVLLVLTTYQILRFKINKKKSLYFKALIFKKMDFWLKLAGFYLLSLCIYELAPSDHVFNANFIEIFRSQFSFCFTTFYEKFVLANAFYYYLLFAVTVLILLVNQKEKEKNFRILLLSWSNLIFTFIFISLGHYIISCAISWNNHFYTNFLYERIYNPYTAILIFTNIVLLGYLTKDIKIKEKDISNIINAILILIFIFVNYDKDWLNSYIADIRDTRELFFEKAKLSYYIQKRIIEQKNNGEIKLPYNEKWAFPYTKECECGINGEKYRKLIIWAIFDENFEKLPKKVYIDYEDNEAKLSEDEIKNMNFTKQIKILNKKIKNPKIFIEIENDPNEN